MLLSIPVGQGDRWAEKHSDWAEPFDVVVPQDYGGLDGSDFVRRSSGPLAQLRLTLHTAHAQSAIADPNKWEYLSSILRRAETLVESMVLIALPLEWPVSCLGGGGGGERKPKKAGVTTGKQRSSDLKRERRTNAEIREGRGR